MFKYLAHILNVAIFPSKCLSCKAFFHAHIDDAVNPIFCSFEQVMSPFLCSACRKDFSPAISLRGINAAGTYSGALREVIHAFKYDGKTSLARPLGMFLFSTFIRHRDSGDIDLILPVPLHIRRLRMRGFNQALLMLKDWKTMAESFKIRLIRIEPELLLRIRHTSPQVELKAKERKANIRGAFSLSNPSMVRGKKILLVDDVYTTGATAAECAKVLLTAGALRTDVLTLARTA